MFIQKISRALKFDLSLYRTTKCDCLTTKDENSLSFSVYDTKLTLIRSAFYAIDLGPVRTYPDIFENATFSIRFHLLSTRVKTCQLLKTPSKVKIVEDARFADTRGRMKTQLFEKHALICDCVTISLCCQH